MATEGDATNPDVNRRAVREVVDRFGRLNIFATFVGVFDHYTPLDSIGNQQLKPAFDEMFGANVLSGTLSTDLRGLRSLGQADIVLDDRLGRPEQLRERTPLNVALEPADHAAAYVFLASDGARGITGETIRSDGGIGVR